VTRTFIDAGVLITAARVTPGAFQAASMQILDDPDRVFLCRPFIRLEVEPKAHFHRRYAEAAFYRAYFENVAVWAENSPSLVEMASDIARMHGLAAMDALHIAAAFELGAEEFVITEAKTKPMFRVPGILVTTLECMP
jgi:predicted nucleic acid-binding protein